MCYLCATVDDYEEVTVLLDTTHVYPKYIYDIILRNCNRNRCICASCRQWEKGKYKKDIENLIKDVVYPIAFPHGNPNKVFDHCQEILVFILNKIEEEEKF